MAKIGNPLGVKVPQLKKKQIAALLPKTVAKTPGKSAAKVGSAATSEVLERLFEVVLSRKGADPSVSHSARLLSRGTPKIAQKFGEEAVECLIEAVRGDSKALIAESADVLYHLLVLWVDAGVTPEDVWAELTRREGVSGIAEKAARPARMAIAAQVKTRKIP